MNKKVLVIGAAGFVGTPITKQLLADGFSVRVFVRNTEKARELLGNQVEIFTGDFNLLPDLEKAIDGCDGVNISAPWKSELQIVQNVVAILTRTGRKQVRVSYISGATALPENRWYPMIDQKLKAEEVLLKSGINCTILKPNWFMDALSLFVNNGRATVFGKQSQPYYFLSLADFARVVSRSHQSDDNGTRSYVINGPEAVLMIDALQQYCDTAYPGMKAAAMPIWFGKILAALLKSESMKDFVQMMAYFEKSPRICTPIDAISQVGAPTQTIADWLKSQSK